jgi:hypothetical protein
MEKPAVFGPKQGSSLVCIQCCRTLQSIKVKKIQPVLIKMQPIKVKNTTSADINAISKGKNTASADKNAINKGKKYNQC